MSKVINEIGRIHHIGEYQKGTSKAGKQWSKQEVVFEIEDNFQSYRYVAITFFGDDVEALDNYKEGDKVAISYFASSREWNGRWYTDLKLFAINPVTAQPEQPRKAAATRPAPAPTQPEVLFQSQESLDPAEHGEDLPF